MKMSRRYFVALIFLNGCATKTRINKSYETKHLSTNYMFKITSTGYDGFSGHATVIERQLISEYRDTYEDKYSIDGEKTGEVGKDIAKNPNMLYCLAVAPLCLAIFGVAGTLSVLDPKSSRIMKKRGSNLVKRETTNESINTKSLPDRDRAVSITISSPDNTREFILLKTNSIGNFAFNFKEYLTKNSKPVGEYKLAFSHNMLKETHYVTVPKSYTSAVMAKHNKITRPSLISNRGTRERNSKDVSRYFTKVEYALSIISTVSLARTIYKYYKKYKWTRRFVKLFLMEVFPLYILTEAIEMAVIEFCKWVLREHGYKV